MRTRMFIACHLALALVAASGLALSHRLEHGADRQMVAYNEGRDLYRTGNLPKALVAWERSIDAYESGLGLPWYDTVNPPPSRRWAANARFWRACAFYNMLPPDQFETVLKELKLAQSLNPGAGDLSGMPPDEVEDAIAAQYLCAVDLEYIFGQRPDLAQQEGKDGKPGKTPGKGSKEGKQRAPGDQRNGTEPGQPKSVDDL